MRLAVKIIFISIAIFSFVAQKAASDELLFKPLFANPFEARVGSFYMSEEKKLRLDIGTSFDFVKFTVDSNEAALGADFFTYTRLRYDGRFKFPVETSDYYFGLNYSMKLPFLYQSAVRFRAAHISSHLVDGYVVNDTFMQKPIVYSREFLELTYSGKWKQLRYYLGLNYIFSTIPKDPNRIIPQIGFDYERPFCDWLSFVFGMDYKLVGIDDIWQGTTSAQLGLTFYTYKHYGIFVGAYMFKGRSIHGQFYRDIDDYMGLGFQFLFL